MSAANPKALAREFAEKTPELARDSMMNREMFYERILIDFQHSIVEKTADAILNKSSHEND